MATLKSPQFGLDDSIASNAKIIHKVHSGMTTVVKASQFMLSLKDD